MLWQLAPCLLPPRVQLFNALAHAHMPNFSSFIHFYNRTRCLLAICKNWNQMGLLTPGEEDKASFLDILQDYVSDSCLVYPLANGDECVIDLTELNITLSERIKDSRASSIAHTASATVSLIASIAVVSMIYRSHASLSTTFLHR